MITSPLPSPDHRAGPRLRAGAGEPRPAAAGPGLALPQDGAGSRHRVKCSELYAFLEILYLLNTQIKKDK